MKRHTYYPIVIILFLLLAGQPALADTVTCKDGRVFKGVIKEETENAVVISVLGADVTVPRSDIKTIHKASSVEDKKLGQEWKDMDMKYKDESAEWEEQEAEQAAESPADTPTPLELPTVEEPEGEEEPEAIVFPSDSALSRPQRLEGEETAEQEKLQWIQEVQQAIHEKRVINGMTPEQVRSAWGFPDLTHEVDNIDTHTDRWEYHTSEGPVYVFFKSGGVVGVNNQGGLNP